MAGKNYQEMAEQILQAVGGKENVQSITHCITRLRFRLKDKTAVKEDEIGKIDGVMGCQYSGEQFQVIVGTSVGKVYSIVSDLAGHAEGGQTEKGEAPKEKLTIKNLGSRIITGLTSCITPVLPVIICAGMLTLVQTVLGPTMLGLLSADSGVYTVLSFAANAGFYFLPVFLGYTSAKYFKANPLIGMLMGAILLHPTFTDLVAAGTPLDIFGIPVTAATYSTSVVPIILICFVMSYVERFFSRIIPDVVKLVFVPVCTVLVMLPLGLCLLGPLGYILGNYISVFFLWLHDVLGPVAVGLIAAAYLPLIITGMHHTINMAAVVSMMSLGYDNVVLVGAAAATLASIGANIGFTLKAKKKENKSLGLTCVVMQALVGLGEPGIYGIYLPHRSVFAAELLGAFSGGVVMSLLGCKLYALTASNIMILLGFVGGESNMNFICAVIGGLVAAVVAIVVTMVLKLKED